MKTKDEIKLEVAMRLYVVGIERDWSAPAKHAWLAAARFVDEMPEPEPAESEPEERPMPGGLRTGQRVRILDGRRIRPEGACHFWPWSDRDELIGQVFEVDDAHPAGYPAVGLLGEEDNWWPVAWLEPVENES